MNRPRRVLIIGASSVLGGATANLFARDSADLWLTYRSEPRLDPLRKNFPQAQISRVDVSQSAEIGRLAEHVSASWDALDALFVCPGIGLLQPAMNWKRYPAPAIFDVNIRALLDISQAFFRLLSRGSFPSLLFLSSIMALAGTSGMSAYAATKGAVGSLARSLAIEWAPRRIRVNALAPGIVPSPLVDQMFAPLSPEQQDTIRDRHPLGFGQPEDVAHAARFLLSPEAKWITGVVLPVDGGYTAQ